MASGHLSEHAALLSELQALHAKLDRLDRIQRATAPHGWLRHVVKNLETDPKTQYKVHFYGAIYWLVNFPAVTALFFFAPALWLRLGIFITLIYSIYANFATDYGSMSAAMAAEHEAPLPELPLEGGD